MVDYLVDDMHVKLPEQYKWINELFEAYPLPEAPPHQCRDEFLKELLEPYVPPEESTESSDSVRDRRLHFGTNATLDTLHGSFNVERDLFQHRDKFMRATARHVSSVFSNRESLIQAPNVFKLIKGRQDKISEAIGYLGVIFELTALKDSLNIFRAMWRVSVTIDKSYKIFSWSINDYLTRFKLPSQTYLDITERELMDQMDCYKFRVDVSETIRLISALSDDVRSKRDVCDHSMLVIDDARTDIEELVKTSEKLAQEEYYNAVTAAHRLPRSADPRRSRTGAVHSKYNYNDFVYPIEARYRIKYAQTQVDQAIMYNDCYIKEMSKELVELKKSIYESQLFWECSQIAFNMQISSLKQRIPEVDATYEVEMESLANNRESLQNKLSKAKEDVVKGTLQIPWFHRRIAEIKNILAQREADTLNELMRLRVSERRSKKKSTTVRKSTGKKKKSVTKYY